MKIGLAAASLGGQSAGADGSFATTVVAAARMAESAGLHSFWLDDRAMSTDGRPMVGSDTRPDSDPEADAYEALVMMGAVAAVTDRIQIGVSMLATPYRHPAIPAKMLATADLVSRGRIVFGVGVGGTEEEFATLGLPASYFAKRQAVTAEYVAAIKEMWTNTGPSNFAGEFIEFRNVGTFPKPARLPHPPIVFGGSDTWAMEQASLIGTGYQAIVASSAELAEQVARLRQICQQDRRDPDELEVSLVASVQLTDEPLGSARSPLHGNPEQVAEDLRAYGKAGLHHLVAVIETSDRGEPFTEVSAGIQTLATELLPALG